MLEIVSNVPEFVDTISMPESLPSNLMYIFTSQNEILYLLDRDLFALDLDLLRELALCCIWRD